MRILRATLLAFALACVPALKADPENFIIGPFTFIRPETWKWNELNDKSHASAQMFITDEKTGDESQVLISFSSTKRDDIASKWKIYFVEPPAVDYHTKSKKIKTFPITYVDVAGTYRVKGRLKNDHALAGIIIETEKGNVFGRVVGPKGMVKNVRADFTKMMEDALKEE